MAGTVVGVASIPIKLDFSGVSKQVSQGGKEAAEGLTRDINGKLRDSKGRFVKSGEDIGDSIKKGVDKKGKDAADGLTSHFKGAFGKIAGLAGGLLIGAQIVSTFKTAFGEAAEAQKIGKLTEQVIKSTGGAAKITAKQIGDLSTAISKKTGIDDEAIQSGANLLATFTKVRNEAGKGNDIFSQTVGLATDMSVALGQDMTSSSLQLGKALNDPIKGVTALTRAGVSFTQGQKDQIKKMQESGDLLGAQKLILAEVQTQFGGAAAAAASPVDKLKVVWGNLLEDLGTRALPLIENVAEKLGKFLPTALDKAGAAFGWLSDRLAGVGRWLVNAVEAGRNIIEFFKLGGGDAQVFGEILSQAFGIKSVAVFRTLYTIVRNVFDFITDTAIPRAKQVIGSFLAGLSGEGGAGSFFTDLGEAARGAFKIFTDQVLPVLKTVVGFIKDNLKPILIGLGLIIAGPVLLIAGGLIFMYQKFQWFRTGVELVIGIVKTIITTAIDVIVAVFNFLQPIIASVARFFMEVLWPAVRSAFGFISTAVMWAWTNVLQPTFNFIAAVIRNVLIPAFNFIKAVVVDFVFPLVMAIIRDAWEFIRPIFGFIASHVSGVVVPAFEAISGAVKAFWGFVKPILQTVITFIQEKLGPVWEGMRLVAKAAFDALPGLISAALRLVGGIVAGFLDGVGSIADAIGLDSIAKVLKSGAGSARRWGVQGVPTTDTRAGGHRNALALGGRVPGSHNRDDVPIRATPGEWVITKPSVEKYERKYGSGFMEAFNAGHFGLGGLIPDIDLQGLADGVVDKARSIGTAGLERVWPKMGTGSKLFSASNPSGLPAAGANYLRDAVIQLIRGKEQAMGSQSGGGFSRAGGGGPAGQYTAGMQRARADILNLFGPMSVGGYSNRNIAGTSTRSEHAKHRAWDFMTGQNVSRGNAVSRHLIANASSYGLRGLIWNAQKNFGSGWAPYGHPGGGRSATLQHLDHVHAEFFSKGGKVPYGLYDQGGFLPTGLSIAENRTGAPERVGGAGIAIGEVHNHGLEDVDAFWRLAEFHAMKGSFG